MWDIILKLTNLLSRTQCFQYDDIDCYVISENNEYLLQCLPKPTDKILHTSEKSKSTGIPAGAHPSPNFKKIQRFCRHDTECFTQCTLQSKLATVIR